MRSRIFLVIVTLAATGCGKQSYRLAPVSGRVQWNGKPLAGAWVHFAPKASKDNLAPGPTAHGRTDRDGRFRLGVDPGHPGAVVGVNRVGSDPQFGYNGRSIMVDPHGEIFADAGDRECCLSAELDLAALLEYRRELPFLADIRSDSAKHDA